MRPHPRLAFFAGVVALCCGCGSGRHAAHYSWLRLEGERGSPLNDPTSAVREEEIDEPEAALAQAPQQGEDMPIDVQPPIGTIRVRPPQTVTPERIALPQDTTDYYQDRPHTWNKAAVASLPVAVIGVGLAIALQSTWLLGIAGALAFALALFGGRHARDNEERGRGFAMPAMIIGSVALFLALLVVVTGL